MGLTVLAGTTEINVAGGQRSYYLDDRGVFGRQVWLYEETNGIFTNQGTGIHYRTVATTHNLQRGDDSPLREEKCREPPVANPDTLLL